jgi:phage gpG-like protein
MVSMEAEIYRDEVLPMLKYLRQRMPTIDKTVRGAIAARIVGFIQRDKLRGHPLHRKSGDLANSINWRHLSDSDTGLGSYGVIYARIHELGGIIRPVHAKALHFQIDGHWITTKKVVMPRRPYILPVLRGVFESGEAMRIAEQVLQAQLAKIEGAA